MDTLDHFRRIFSIVLYQEDAADKSLPPAPPLNLRQLRGGSANTGTTRAAAVEGTIARQPLDTAPLPVSETAEDCATAF